MQKLCACSHVLWCAKEIYTKWHCLVGRGKRVRAENKVNGKPIPRAFSMRQTTSERLARVAPHMWKAEEGGLDCAELGWGKRVLDVDWCLHRPDCVHVVSDADSVGVWHFHADEIEESGLVDLMLPDQPPILGLAGFATMKKNGKPQRRLVWQIVKDKDHKEIMWVFEHTCKGREVFAWQHGDSADMKPIDPGSHRFFHGMTYQPCKTHLLGGCGLNAMASGVLGGDEHYLVYAVSVDSDSDLHSFASAWLLDPVWSREMHEQVLISTSATLHYSTRTSNPHVEVYGIGRHGHGGRETGMLKRVLQGLSPKLGKFELSLKTHGFSSAVIGKHLASQKQRQITHMRQPATLKPMVFAHRCYKAFRRNSPDLLPELNFWGDESLGLKSTSGTGSLIAYSLKECSHENFFDYTCPRAWLELNKRQPKWLPMSCIRNFNYSEDEEAQVPHQKEGGKGWPTLREERAPHFWHTARGAGRKTILRDWRGISETEMHVVGSVSLPGSPLTKPTQPSRAMPRSVSLPGQFKSQTMYQGRGGFASSRMPSTSPLGETLLYVVNGRARLTP